MAHTTGCFICGKDLVYLDNHVDMRCSFCENSYSSNAQCVDGHYICDTCHAMNANDIIEHYCKISVLEDPFEMAQVLMKHPSINMHGPEHHFLVPAVLIAAYYNRKKDSSEKENKLAKARQRAEKVPGGACGFYGNCGAAVGTGIFMSLILNAKPTSREEWKEANLITAKSLLAVAERGGPRCCKRNTLLALSAVADHMHWEIPKKIECTFSDLNRECLGTACLYYKS